VNLIRLRRPASLRALVRSPGQDLKGSAPSAAPKRRGPLAGSPVQKANLNGTKWRGWGGGVVEARRVGSEREISGETRRAGGRSDARDGKFQQRPKNRPAGVRASVGARKRGNARGAKGRGKVGAE
jgi:hypothetical protein